MSILDDEHHFDPEDAVIHVDPETQEEYVINPAGTKIYLEPSDEQEQ